MTELLQTKITGPVAFTIYCQSSSETSDSQETVSEPLSSFLLFVHPPYIYRNQKQFFFTRDNNVTSLPGPINSIQFQFNSIFNFNSIQFYYFYTIYPETFKPNSQGRGPGNEVENRGTKQTAVRALLN